MFRRSTWVLLFIWTVTLGIMAIVARASGSIDTGDFETYLPVLIKPPSKPISITVPIAANDQDGFEDPNFYISGDFYNNNWVGTDTWVITGWVFDDVTIPVGAIVTDAYIQFRGFGNNGSATARIHAFAEDSASPFVASGANKPSTRPVSSTFVDWPNAWTFVWQWFTTPDLSPIIQEVIERPGWSSGNNIGFRVSSLGTGINWAVADYAAGPYDGNDGAGHSVTLYVTYAK